MTMLGNRMEDYYFVSQGKTRIPGVNDGEEMELTDVSLLNRRFILLTAGQTKCQR
jgi:hypothetical protein